MTDTPYLDGEKLSTRTFFQKDLLLSIVELLANYGSQTEYQLRYPLMGLVY